MPPHPLHGRGLAGAPFRPACSLTPSPPHRPWQFAPAAAGAADAPRFRYYVQPVVSSIWPTGGVMAGGTAVTVHGTGFSRFGAAALAAAAATDAAPTTTPAPPPPPTPFDHAADAPLCLFGGHCFDAHGVHRGLGVHYSFVLARMQRGSTFKAKGLKCLHCYARLDLLPL